jgi:hypothetical protein
MNFTHTHTYPATDIAGLLNRVSPDLLQLDVVVPLNSPIHHENALGWERIAHSVSILHSALYLRPELCVVTNVGYPDPLGSVAALAEFLVSHGSSELLVAFIRGDNLLPYLGEILPDNVVSKDSRVLSARLEVGGGPFGTAFDDGARFIIAGTYDASAPLLGAAVVQGICGWGDENQLALLAAASHFEDLKVALAADGGIDLELTATTQLDHVRRLGLTAHADVLADFTHLSLERTHRDTLRPENVKGSSSHSVWNARIVVEEGFQATALVAGKADALGRLVGQMPVEFDGDSLKHTEYFPTVPGNADRGILMRMEYAGTQQEPCREFINWLELSLQKQPAIGQLITPLPTVMPLTKTISVQIPADVVTISVDTRPACEWL